MEYISSSPQTPLDTSKPTKLYGSACDTCRRRRVKCDGNQPCDRCMKSGVSCSYGSLSNRASSVSYARHLEQKVAELRNLLHERPESESRGSIDEIERTKEGIRREAVDMLIGPGDDLVYRMVESNSNGFLGRFGGLNVIRTLGVKSARLTHSPHMERFSHGLVQTSDILSLSSTSRLSIRSFAMLPPKHEVQILSDQAINTALVCHECLDRQDFTRHLDYLYDIDPEEYLPGDRSFLALVYVMVALGKRYSPTSEDDEIDENSTTMKFKGLAYFHASRDALNITEANDLNAVRAVICQARYLASMSMISTAYSQICIGVAIALRLGLHSSSPAIRAAFSKEELFERRKVFATLNMMEIYLSSLLGLPFILKDGDLDQTLGLPDHDLENEGRLYVVQNVNSPLAQTVMCQRINRIMAKVCNARTHLKDTRSEMSEEFYEENADQVADREADLEDWCKSLPALSKEHSDLTNLQADLTLRVWHALVQIVLYRPFLHHLAVGHEERQFSMVGFENASKCVRAAMQGILTVDVFHKSGILHEGYWLCVYMLEFAVAILLYFISSSPQSATVEESKIAAIKAKNILGDLARYNLSARKCFESLKVVLDMPQSS